jgi:hypothetical protein
MHLATWPSPVRLYIPSYIYTVKTDVFYIVLNGIDDGFEMLLNHCAIRKTFGHSLRKKMQSE